MVSSWVSFSFTHRSLRVSTYFHVLKISGISLNPVPLRSIAATFDREVPGVPCALPCASSPCGMAGGFAPLVKK